MTAELQKNGKSTLKVNSVFQNPERNCKRYIELSKLMTIKDVFGKGAAHKAVAFTIIVAQRKQFWNSVTQPFGSHLNSKTIENLGSSYPEFIGFIPLTQHRTKI